MTPGDIRTLLRLLQRIAEALEIIVNENPKQIRTELKQKWPRK